MFWKIRDKEMLNLEGRGRRRVWKWTLLIFPPLDHKLNQNFPLLLGSLGFPVSCPGFAFPSDILERSIINMLSLVDYFTKGIFEAFCIWKFRLVYRFFQAKERFTKDSRETVILTSVIFTSHWVVFSDLKHPCRMLSMQMWIVILLSKMHG